MNNDIDDKDFEILKTMRTLAFTKLPEFEKQLHINVKIFNEQGYNLKKELDNYSKIEFTSLRKCKDKDQFEIKSSKKLIELYEEHYKLSERMFRDIKCGIRMMEEKKAICMKLEEYCNEWGYQQLLKNIQTAIEDHARGLSGVYGSIENYKMKSIPKYRILLKKILAYEKSNKSEEFANKINNLYDETGYYVTEEEVDREALLIKINKIKRNKLKVKGKEAINIESDENIFE